MRRGKAMDPYYLLRANAQDGSAFVPKSMLPQSARTRLSSVGFDSPGRETLALGFDGRPRPELWLRLPGPVTYSCAARRGAHTLP